MTYLDEPEWKERVMDRGTLYEAMHGREVASAFYLDNPRVTLIDVGLKMTGGEYTGELAVRVHVREKPTEAVFEAFSVDNPDLVIDKSIIPFPVDIIEASYHLQWDWWLPRPTNPRAKSFDPLRGGISVSSEQLFGYGTLGLIVEDRDTKAKMILSNWHVLAASEYALPGMRIFQPAYGDGGSNQDTVAILERHVFNVDIDAAVARLTNAREWVNDLLEIGPVTGSAAPVLGMPVTKSGRASGVTHGIVDGIEGVYPIWYGGMTHRIRYVNRIVPAPGFDEVSRGGDSGSCWVHERTHQAVALHFAGQNDPETALAISMPQVLDALNVDVVTAGQVVPAGPGVVLVPEGIGG